jgi:Lon protease-like protein
VFEPRYVQMVEDLLDRDGRLVVGTIREERSSELTGEPPVYAVAGYGEIGKHERLDDGRYDIWVAGLTRVTITEVPSDRMYRRVRAEAIDEIEPADDEAAVLRKRLLPAVRRRAVEALKLPESVPLGTLADLLLHLIPLPAGEMQHHYEEIDVKKRALAALDLHEQFPAPPSEEG